MKSNFNQISVVLPNYNDAHTICQAIDSVLAQDYPNFELIIIDDGSTDPSLEVISKYQKNPKVKLIRRKENKGVEYSQNEGLAHAKGEYLFLFSSNDVLLPRFFSKSMECLLQDPAIGICCSDTIEWNTESGTKHLHSAIPGLEKALKIPSHELPKMIFHSFLRLGGRTAVMKTELVRKEGGVKASLACSADWFLVTKLAFSHGIFFIPEALTCWRNSQASYTQKILGNCHATKEMYHNLFEELHTCEKEVLRGFRKSGELGYILKAAPSTILRRPQFWTFCPTAIARYLLRSLKRAPAFSKKAKTSAKCIQT